MTNKLEKAIENPLASPSPFLTDSDLTVLLKGTADSRYGIVKRALAGGRLTQVRRGLYLLSPSSSAPGLAVNKFELAQWIYGPSYVSLESALSFHGLIPEAVPTVTCACAKRSKEFKTPLGVFSYARLPQDELFIQVERHSHGPGRFFLMAEPLKALTDYVYIYRKDWKTLREAAAYLRLDVEELKPSMTHEKIAGLETYYGSHRTNVFLAGIRKESNV